MRANLAIVNDQAAAGRAFLAAESERLRLQIQEFARLAEKAREMTVMVDADGTKWMVTIDKQGALKSEKLPEKKDDPDAPPAKR